MCWNEWLVDKEFEWQRWTGGNNAGRSIILFLKIRYCSQNGKSGDGGKNKCLWMDDSYKRDSPREDRLKTRMVGDRARLLVWMR